MRLSSNIALAVLLGLAACGEDESAAPPPPPPPKAKAKAKAAGAAPAAAAVPFAYSPVGKRDPFQSYLAELRAAGAAEAKRKREATEEYELDQYKLSGLVTGTAQPKAMVEDPTGRGFAVVIGSRLGKNSGVVTRISSTEIVVTEEFRAPTGEKVRVPITVKMPAPELDISIE